MDIFLLTIIELHCISIIIIRFTKNKKTNKAKFASKLTFSPYAIKD